VPDGKTDWEALDKLSDDEIERRALADPDAVPLREEDMARMRQTPRVKVIRRALRMTQEEFAERFGLSLATIRDWEQGRTEPDQASRTLLKLIARMPDQVEAALAAGRRSATE
jgi:putative transcriptional regulator